MGSIREALTSLYDLFAVTRTTLKEQGPTMAEGKNSLGLFAIDVLNLGVRPFILEWHTALSAFEEEKTAAQKAAGTSKADMVQVDETAWDRYDDFYRALGAFQNEMAEYVRALGVVAGIEEG